MTTTHGGRRAGAGRKPHPEARHVRRLINLAPEVDRELSRLMRLYKLKRAPMVARLIEQASAGH